MNCTFIIMEVSYKSVSHSDDHTQRRKTGMLGIDAPLLASLNYASMFPFPLSNWPEGWCKQWWLSTQAYNQTIPTVCCCYFFVIGAETG